MALQIDTNINVDFYDNKYIMINAKQYDSSSRWITITCYDNGSLFNLSASKHSAYIRYKKADGYGVLNSCRINYKGEVLVELTEQMLAADGICYVDLIIINKGSAIVDIGTGKINIIDNTQVLSTMAFCVQTYEAVVDNSEFESSYEYDGLNDLLQRAEAEYSEVVQLSRSYAIGDANDIRDGEDFDNSKYYSRLSRSYAIGDANGVRSGENTDNSKYYSEQSSNSADAAATSEENAESYMNTTNEYMNTTESYMNTTKSHMDVTKSYMDTTNEYMGATQSYMNTTNEYMGTVNEYMVTTESYMNNTNEYMNMAKSYMDTANEYMGTTQSYMNTAKSHMDDAATSENNALNSANYAQSYAVGGTGTRENEDITNAQYYCNVVKNVVDGLNSGFIPMGTISFSQLATAEKATGFTYNISDDFVTDDSFAEGAGKSYTAGVNVYWTATGAWDCFGGSSSPMATVDEVKDYLGINDSGEIM